MPANWTALTASVRGAVHERDGRPNQDAARVRLPENASAPLFLAVADGHGSARSFRSDRGSVMAAACALRAFDDLTRRAGPDELSWSRLRHEFTRRWPALVVDHWRRTVRADIEREPFSIFEFAPFPEPPPKAVPGRELPFHAYLAYGATLVFTAVTRRHVFYAQLGDGDILLVQDDGRITRPWERTHAFFANETVSMCSAGAAGHFRCKVEPLRSGAAPAVILLATDGYANCFSDDEGFFRVGADLFEYLREGGPDFVREKLAPWLRQSSRDGSGDDITVGLAVRLGALKGARPPAEASAS
jgi:hypothetical protein